MKKRLHDLRRPKLPSIAGYSRCSGATTPFLPSAWERRYCFRYRYRSQMRTVGAASKHPMPKARKTRPDSSVSKPYTEPKTYGKAAKKVNRTPKLKAMYKLRKPTIGSVTSIWSGRINVTVRRKYNFFPILGDGGAGRPSLTLRFSIKVFLYVSRIGMAVSQANTAKKIRVH
jgi:hypothetical protein